MEIAFLGVGDVGAPLVPTSPTPATTWSWPRAGTARTARRPRWPASEHVQGRVPGAKVVKAFTIHYAENLEDPAYPGYAQRPASRWTRAGSSRRSTSTT